MGGEETLWRNAYEAIHCIDCLNFTCGRCTDDMIACQWCRLLKNIGDWLNDDDISD